MFAGLAPTSCMQHRPGRSWWLLASCLAWAACGSPSADRPGSGNGGSGGDGGHGGEGGAGAGGAGGTVSRPDAATAGKGGTGGGAEPTPDAGPAAPDTAPTTPPPSDAASAETASVTPPTSGLTKIFDGTPTSFSSDWVYNPAAWTLRDGAMVGKTGSGQSQAFTKKDYSNFRLIVWSRMVNGNDHLGICLWGGRPAAGRYGFERCLLVIPPNGAIWDYLTNRDNPRPDYQKGMAEWHKTEILANRTTGKVLVAVNGKLVHEYQDAPGNLSRRQNGPVGMQIHKAGTESEYKDIEIEVDPASDKLLTLTAP